MIGNEGGETFVDKENQPQGGSKASKESELKVWTFWLHKQLILSFLWNYKILTSWKGFLPLFAVFADFLLDFFEININPNKSNIFHLLFFLKMWDFKHLKRGNAKPENETLKTSKPSKQWYFYIKIIYIMLFNAILCYIMLPWIFGVARYIFPPLSSKKWIFFCEIDFPFFVKQKMNIYFFRDRISRICQAKNNIFLLYRFFYFCQEKKWIIFIEGASLGFPAHCKCICPASDTLLTHKCIWQISVLFYRERKAQK